MSVDHCATREISTDAVDADDDADEPADAATGSRPRPGTARGCPAVLAPTASRRPISRVRSVTETSMMFMIPMPPTISDTDAIAPSSIAITCADVSCAANTSVRLRT